MSDHRGTDDVTRPDLPKPRVSYGFKYDPNPLVNMVQNIPLKKSEHSQDSDDKLSLQQIVQRWPVFWEKALVVYSYPTVIGAVTTSAYLLIDKLGLRVPIAAKMPFMARAYGFSVFPSMAALLLCHVGPKATILRHFEQRVPECRICTDFQTATIMGGFGVAVPLLFFPVYCAMTLKRHRSLLKVDSRYRIPPFADKRAFLQFWKPHYLRVSKPALLWLAGYLVLGAVANASVRFGCERITSKVELFPDEMISELKPLSTTEKWWHNVQRKLSELQDYAKNLKFWDSK